MEKHEGVLAFLNEGRLDNSGPCMAYWLGGSYEGSKWKIGERTINWEYPLPDGSLLTDDQNRYLLKSIKRIAFEIRNSPLTRDMGDLVHVKHIYNIMTLLDFAVYNRKIYLPTVHIFSLLDKNSMKEFICRFVEGGQDNARYVKERIVSFFKKEIIYNEKYKTEIMSQKNKIIEEVFKLNTKDKVVFTFKHEEIKAIKIWLYQGGYYESFNPKRKGLINRQKIIKKIELGFSNFFCPMINIFLRQFEFVQDYFAQEMELRFPGLEYFPANRETQEELASRPIKENTLRAMCGTLNVLQNISGVVDGLPQREAFDHMTPEAIKQSFEVTPSEHYPTVPVAVAMHLMNEAIRWVLVYGDSLVDLVLDFARKANSCTKTGKTDEKRSAFSELIIPEVLKPLKINRYLRLNTTPISNEDCQLNNYYAKSLRENLSLEDSLYMLMAAIYILIASLNARRAKEILSLKLNCLKGVEGEYELEFKLLKANKNGAGPLVSKPIPDLVAKGVLLLKRLVNGWKDVFQIETDNLFWRPDRLAAGSTYTAVFANLSLDHFCDYIEVQLNEKGQRWYIRTHQCRRFFAIVFFWQFKYSNLSSLQWMLGHLDPSYTYAYIKESIGGAEMTIEEARITAAAIKDENNSQGLIILKKFIKEHFNTENINLIEDDDLEFYLISLLQKGSYQVRPHSIVTSSGVAYEIVFEIHQEI